MANTFVLLTYPVSCSEVPTGPLSDEALSEMLLHSPDLATHALELYARNNSILGMVLSIINHYILNHARAPGLLFFAQRFVVLDDAALVETTRDLRRLLEDIRLNPRLVIEPLAVTCVDGSKHEPYDAEDVLDGLDTAPVVLPPALISTDHRDLVVMFSFLKSELSLFVTAQEERTCVVYLRYNELSEYLQTPRQQDRRPH